jgi:N-acetylglucosamine malate deacetylase 1
MTPSPLDAGQAPGTVDVLAVGAHPDDVELGAGGTLLRHHRAGYAVGVVDLTRGELGSKGDPDTRAREARDAATVYGARWRACLDLGDGAVRDDADSVHRLAAVIRTSRPRLVLTHHHEDRHPDHVSAHALVRRAVFAAALERLDLGVAHHVTAGLLCFPTDRVVDADVYVDVTAVWEERLGLLRRFASQFDVPTLPIDHTLYGIHDHLEAVAARARVHGQRIGVTYAEAFVSTGGIAVDDLVALVSPAGPTAR